MLNDCFQIFDSAGSLTHEAREAFLSALVSEGMLHVFGFLVLVTGLGGNVSGLFFCLTGRAEWMDKGHRKCLILWHRIQDWADIILQFVSFNSNLIITSCKWVFIAL